MERMPELFHIPLLISYVMVTTPSSTPQLGRVIIMPVYPPHGGAMGLSPSSSFQSDSLYSSTPKPSIPAGSQTGWKQSQKDSETSSDGTPSSRGSGSGGGVKFLLALNAPSSVPWGLIRAKVSVLLPTKSSGTCERSLMLIFILHRAVTSGHSSALR
jgi:hypothetical protein